MGGLLGGAEGYVAPPLKFFFFFFWGGGAPTPSSLAYGLGGKKLLCTVTDRFGPISFRSGRFGLDRFGPISGVCRFGPVLVDRFGPLYFIHFVGTNNFRWLAQLILCTVNK